jgi:acetaldehyde dehydrogenase (acetylating)
MLEDKDLVSIQEVRTKVEKAYAAWQKYRTYSQAQVDAIVERMAAAARANAKRLAEMAVEETGYGNAKDKYIKNLLNSDWLPRRMRGMKTVGMLRELPEEKMVEIGVSGGRGGGHPAHHQSHLHRHLQDADFAQSRQRHRHQPASARPSLHLRHRRGAVPGRGGSRRARGHHPVRRHRHLEGTNALMRHERTGVILSTGGRAS